MGAFCGLCARRSDPGTAWFGPPCQTWFGMIEQPNRALQNLPEEEEGEEEAGQDEEEDEANDEE